MQSNNKLYLLVCLAISNDNYHKDNNLIHLVSSIFYTKDFNTHFEELTQLNETNNLNTVVLRVTRETSLYLNIKQYNNSLVHIEISFIYFWDLYLKSRDYSEFVEEIFQQSYKDLNTNSLKGTGYKNILYVFEDLTWLETQWLFKMKKVVISGGSISNRQYLSTSEFNLSLYLYLLGYRDVDIHESHNLAKLFKTKEANSEMNVDNKNSLAPEFLSLLLNTWYDEELGKYDENIQRLEQEILSRKEIIQFSKNEQTVKNKEILSQNKSVYNSKRLKKIEINILEQGKALLIKEKELSDLNTQLLELSQKKENVSNLSLTELKSEYNQYVYKFKKSKDISTVKNLLSKTKKLGSAPLPLLPLWGNGKGKEGSSHSPIIKRSYTTSSRQINPSTQLRLTVAHNNLVSIHQFSKKDLNQISQVKIRNMSSVYTNSLVSQKLMEIIHSNDNKENIQLKIENYLISEQNNSLIHHLSDTKLDYSVLNPKIIKILLESKKDLQKLYVNFTSDLVNSSEELYDIKNILQKVDFEFIQNIIYGRLLFILSNDSYIKRYQTEIAYSLGKEIINKYNFNLYLKSEDPTFITFSIFKNNSDQIKEDNDVNLCVKIGNVFIGWLIELKLIQSKVIVIKKNEKRHILSVGDSLNYLLPKDKQVLKNLPVKIPMLVPPKKYVKEDKAVNKIKLGGYLLNDIKYTEGLFIDNPYLVNKTELSEENIIYNMVNNINSVSFAINQDVLNFILKNYQFYDFIIDPDYKHPLNLKSKLTLTEKKELESFNSKRALEAEILNLAHIFSSCSEFFLPVRLDYRGRMYCNVEYLNYQGIELAKSLLIFSKGEKVYLKDELSLDYLKIFGANCFGNKLDKQSFRDRIQWINDNLDNIQNFKDGHLIHQAENKLLFIAFCFEMNKYLKALKNNESYFISHLPVQLDASCNGFQHLSLLLEDISLAKEVNLGKTNWDDVPYDFYTFLALKIKDYLKNELLNNPNMSDKEKESYLRLRNIDFQNHRNLVKKTIMTIPYNATKFANIENMKEDFISYKKEGEIVFEYKKDRLIIFKEIDFVVICKSLYICIYRDFPKLEALLNYFKLIAKIANKLGIYIPWYLPTGLIVKQSFYGSKTIKLKPFIYTKDLLNINILDKNKFNTRKQIRALMPNLVHSLDGASLALLIDNLFKEDGNIQFFAVHDCFAVTCNKVQLLGSLLKLSYYKIYKTESFLKNFDFNFKESILKQFGSQCYSEKDNLITITTETGENIKLNYPNIDKVLEPTKLEFMESSYYIN